MVLVLLQDFDSANLLDETCKIINQERNKTENGSQCRDQQDIAHSNYMNYVTQPYRILYTSRNAFGHNAGANLCSEKDRFSSIRGTVAFTGTNRIESAGSNDR